MVIDRLVAGTEVSGCSCVDEGPSHDVCALRCLCVAVLFGHSATLVVSHRHRWAQARQ